MTVGEALFFMLFNHSQKLAAVAGVDINAAAIAAGFVILDLTAIELADRAGAVNIHAATIAGGRIAGDLAAYVN